jgi:hypothetical protein
LQKLVNMMGRSLIISVEKIGKTECGAIRKRCPVIWILCFRNRRFVWINQWIAILITWFTCSLSATMHQIKNQTSYR